MTAFSHWLLWVVGPSLSAWLYLVLGHSDFWRTRPMLDPVPPSRQDLPDVVAVVPARNEAAYVGRSLRSLLAQDYGGRLSVILVDDHSEDATRAIAQAVPVPPGRSLEVIGAGPLPAGWSGKLWALSEGLRHAAARMPGARYVLLTDADIAHDRGNLRRLVAKAEAERLDLVSLMVRLHCEHLWERLLIPPFVFFFRKLYPFAAVNRQRDPVAAAAGGCTLVRRTALARAGGIEAIRDRLIDDVALARRIKHHPLPSSGQIWLGLTESTHSLRRQTRLSELGHDRTLRRRAAGTLAAAARRHGARHARTVSGATARGDWLAAAQGGRRRGARPGRLAVHDARVLADRATLSPASALGLDVAARRGSLHGDDD